MNTSLAKKTKAELIADYEALLLKQKEFEGAAKVTFSEERTKAVAAVEKMHSFEAVEKTANALRTAATNAVAQFAQAFEGQVRRFEELQKVTAYVEERLKLLRELEAGAEVGTQLIASFESERAALEAEIATKRREWERAQDEAEYKVRTERRRTDEQAEEERRKKEAALKEREAMLAVREKELADKVKRLDTFDTELDKEANRRLTEAKKQWETEHTRELFEKDRERELDEKLHGLQMKELQEDVKRLETECAQLRKDADQANKRAQDLALKIVEGGARERVTASTSVEK